MWLDADKNVVIESFYIGDTTRWIEVDYGEDGATFAVKLDYRDFNAVRKVFSDKFPTVANRITDYEKIAVELSSRYGIALSIRYDAGKTGATPSLNAKVRGATAPEERRQKIELAVVALKQAWDKITRYESHKREPRT